jgi:hypothetical protein
LRIVREGGGEAAYVLREGWAVEPAAGVPLRIVNRESSGGSVSLVAETDGSGAVHNRIELDLDGVEFRTRVRLEASDDGRNWAYVREAAYIFRYRTADGEEASHTAIEYPDSRRRLLRVTLFHWPNAAAVRGARLRMDTAPQARRSEIWSGQLRFGAVRERKSCAESDSGSAAPRDRMVLEAPAAPAAFHRGVTLHGSADGKRWTWLGAGAVYRTSRDEALSVRFPETAQRWIRVCIFQGDDAPVEPAAARLLGVRRELYFLSGEPGTYWLYSGNRDAAAPSYDLVRTADAAMFDRATEAVAGPVEANPGYRPPPDPVRPWTERYPALLYAVLVSGGLGLGWVALRLLRASS